MDLLGLPPKSGTANNRHPPRLTGAPPGPGPGTWRPSTRRSAVLVFGHGVDEVVRKELVRALVSVGETGEAGGEPLAVVDLGHVGPDGAGAVP